MSIELRTGDVCRVKVAKLRFSTFEETDQGAPRCHPLHISALTSCPLSAAQAAR